MEFFDQKHSNKQVSRGLPGKVLPFAQCLCEPQVMGTAWSSCTLKPEGFVQSWGAVNACQARDRVTVSESSTVDHLETLGFLLVPTVYLKVVYILGSRFDRRWKAENIVILRAYLREVTRGCDYAEKNK